jgi:uncharacterized membrane protein YoaK (UPF0700 family)
MKIATPDLLTLNGGYVDTAGYLALQGLFTAHVTGNFVIAWGGLRGAITLVLARDVAQNTRIPAATRDFISTVGQLR